MKNKFMTKALAVVLSASMALSLSSATALTANAAAAPKLAKKTVSVKAGKKAKNKLKAASYKAGWRITKATVKKTAVAKAKVKKNKKVVVVTGVKKGATKIVLKLKNAKTGAAKKLKFKAKVKAVETPIEEPGVETASITDAKQTTYDTVVLTFDKAVDGTLVSGETVAINGSVGAATSVTLAQDGLSATVVYGYAENTDYTFTITALGGSKTVSTGSYKVTAIKAADQTVEAGSDQPIEYSLVAGEVDVTKYNNNLDFVIFEIEGDNTSDSPDPAKPTIYFDEKDKTATVTIKYNNTVDPELTQTFKITSVAAQATKATARFADSLQKWYLVDGSSEYTKNITPEDEAKTVVFFAKSDDGKKAVKFSDVEVKSSNENVATVSWDQSASGKYYTFTVTPGGEAGTAKMTITASEYKGTDEVISNYEFTVVSKEKNNNISNVETSQASVTLYNGQIGNNQEVKMNPVNSLGERVEAEFNWEVTKGGESSDYVQVERVSKWDGEYLKISALGAPAGTYKVAVTVTGESGNNTRDINKNITVRVVDVLSSIYEYPADATDDEKKYELWDKKDTTITANSKAGAQVKSEISATYKIEVANLSITDTSCDDVKGVNLAVYVGGKPVGYLKSGIGIAGFEEGAVIARRAIKKSTSATEQIDLDAIYAFVYSGSNYYTAVNGEILYLGQNAKYEYTTKKGEYSSKNTIHVGGEVSIYSSANALNPNGISFDSNKRPVNGFDYYGAGSTKNQVAKDGSYNVVIKYMSKEFVKDTDKDASLFENGKQLGNAAKFTVSYNLTMPTLEWNPSEQAEHAVIADVDIVRDEDGASVTVSKKAKNKDLNNMYESFGSQSVSKGDKIYAVRVQDRRGDGTGDSAGAPGAGKVLVNFIIEKTTTIKA